MRHPDWRRLFPERDFRWDMSLRPGDAGDFFAGSSGSSATLSLRERLLAEAPASYALLPPAADAAVAEALDLFSRWTGRVFRDGWEAGRGLEPDWVLLQPDAAGCLRVVAGVVCFPSQWSLPEKAGRPVEEVHAPVPGLNQALGRGIDTFLARLAPGAEWERENWGLSADESLDHHPRLPCRTLGGDESLAEVWLRLERQLFVRLPGGGVLFGIHVSNHRLDRLLGCDPALGPRLARALRTMPETAAVYKGIAAARPGIAAQLEAPGGITAPGKPESPNPRDPGR